MLPRRMGGRHFSAAPVTHKLHKNSGFPIGTGAAAGPCVKAASPPLLVANVGPAAAGCAPKGAAASHAKAGPKSVTRGLYFADLLEGFEAEKRKQEIGQPEVSAAFCTAAVPAEPRKTLTVPLWASPGADQPAAPSSLPAPPEEASPRDADSTRNALAVPPQRLGMEAAASARIETRVTPGTPLMVGTRQLPKPLAQDVAAAPERSDQKASDPGVVGAPSAPAVAATLERVAAVTGANEAEKQVPPAQAGPQSDTQKSREPKGAPASPASGFEVLRKALVTPADEPAKETVPNKADAAATLASFAMAAEPAMLEMPGPDPAITDLKDPPLRADHSSSCEPPAPNPQTTLAFRARLVPVSLPAGAIAARTKAGDTGESEFGGTKSAEDMPKTGSQAKASAERKAKEPDGAQPIRFADPAKPAPSPGVGLFPVEKAGAPGSQDTSAEHVAAPASRESAAGEPASVCTPLPAAAHAIQLQMDGVEQRVNVLLAQRGTEVHVSVRTPDPQLAGALRQQLPALSSRLEQNGFQTEIWHPAQWHPPERRAPASEANLSGPSPGKDGETYQGRQQQHPEPRQSKAPGARSGTVTSRKEFQWLMSQLP